MNRQRKLEAKKGRLYEKLRAANGGSFIFRAKILKMLYLDLLWSHCREVSGVLVQDWLQRLTSPSESVWYCSTTWACCIKFLVINSLFVPLLNSLRSNIADLVDNSTVGSIGGTKKIYSTIQHKLKIQKFE